MMPFTPLRDAGKERKKRKIKGRGGAGWDVRGQERRGETEWEQQDEKTEEEVGEGLCESLSQNVG